MLAYRMAQVFASGVFMVALGLLNLITSIM